MTEAAKEWMIESIIIPYDPQGGAARRERRTDDGYTT
jgi:hypothetical protein